MQLLTVSLVTWILPVGYGDLYPISHPGRVVAVLASILGTAILALFIAAVFDFVQFDSAEKRMQRMLYKSRIGRDLKNVSCKLITDAIRLKIAHKKVERASAHAKPKVSAAALTAAQRFQESRVHRSVRAFRVVNAQRLAYARNDAADPSVHVACAISVLQDKFEKTTVQQTAWNEKMEQRLDTLQEETKAVNQRLGLIHELLERQFK
jgi:hypothetical protein